MAGSPRDSSIVVGVCRWSLVVQEEIRVERGLNRLKRQWVLREIEAMEHVVGADIGVSQGRQLVVLLDKFQNASEIVGLMRNVMSLCLRRHYDHRQGEC